MAIVGIGCILPKAPDLGRYWENILNKVDAITEVQDSPRYPAGLVLRFARVKAHRPDKAATEADTLATVRAIHAGEQRPRR